MKHTSRWMFGRVDITTALADLPSRAVNYDPVEVSAEDWHFDTYSTLLGMEQPGPPQQGGLWERARQLAQDYEFCPPNILQAVYDPAVPLRGRNMLLQGRFYALHFYFGVRVTMVTDEQHDNGDRMWSWTYETLQGHLERGSMTYQVTKHHDSGRVEFVTIGYSQRAPTVSRVESLGWRLFGRWMQARFYRGCGVRMRRQLLIEPPRSAPGRAGRPENLRRAPSDAAHHRWERVALHRIDPG